MPIDEEQLITAGEGEDVVEVESAFGALFAVHGDGALSYSLEGDGVFCDCEIDVVAREIDMREPPYGQGRAL
jgi:hypothetical protein